MANACDRCGTEILDSSVFCQQCGTPTNAQTRASNYAAPAPPGAPLYAAPVPPSAPLYAAPAPPSAPFSGTGSIPWIILGIVILALSVLVGYLLLGHTIGVVEPGVIADTTATTPRMPETVAVGNEMTKYVVTTTDIRNIATAQGPDSQVRGTVQRGQQVRGVMHEGLGGDSFWFRLSDGRGYLSAVNLSDGPPAQEAPAPAPVVVTSPVSYGAICIVSTRGGSLRIRRTPGGPIVGGLPRGMRVQAFDQTNAQGEAWVYITPQSYGYASGWVATRFLSC